METQDSQNSEREPRFGVKMFDHGLLAKTRASWGQQTIGDANSPYSIILDEVERSLTEEVVSSSNRVVFYAIMDGDLVLGISELVFCSAGKRCRIVKQLDTHLCPNLHDKLVFEEVDEAKEEALGVYLTSLLHAFAVNEDMHPEALRLYAREPVQLSLFRELAKAISGSEPDKLKVRIIGRWLNIEGCLGGKKENVQ